MQTACHHVSVYLKPTFDCALRFMFLSASVKVHESKVLAFIHVIAVHLGIKGTLHAVFLVICGR